MAKQFNLLATDADLHSLEGVLRATGDVDFLSDVAFEDLSNLRPLLSLPIPISSAGRVSLFCYLAPRNLPSKILIERESAVKVRIDVDESHLIEFWRPFYDGRVLRPGRLYYQNRVLVGRRFVDKSKAFCSWADSVMFRVRKASKYDRAESAYIGREAAAA